MAWTYGGTPGTDTAAERRDAVRWFVGDTDTNDQQVTDEEIAFALSQASDSTYLAAAIVARSIAGKYARDVNSSVESLRISASEKQEHYLALADRMEKQAKQFGAGGLGVPLFGGTSRSTMDSVDANEDRVDPAFRVRQFRNPPRYDDADHDY